MHLLYHNILLLVILISDNLPVPGKERTKTCPIAFCTESKKFRRVISISLFLHLLLAWYTVLYHYTKYMMFKAHGSFYTQVF